MLCLYFFFFFFLLLFFYWVFIYLFTEGKPTVYYDISFPCLFIFVVLFCFLIYMCSVVAIEMKPFTRDPAKQARYEAHLAGKGI